MNKGADTFRAEAAPNFDLMRKAALSKYRNRQNK